MIFQVWRKGREKHVREVDIAVTHGRFLAKIRAVEAVVEIEDKASGYTLFNVAGAAKEITFQVKMKGGMEVNEFEISREVKTAYRVCSIMRTVLPQGGFIQMAIPVVRRVEESEAK